MNKRAQKIADCGVKVRKKCIRFLLISLKNNYNPSTIESISFFDQGTIEFSNLWLNSLNQGTQFNVEATILRN